MEPAHSNEIGARERRKFVVAAVVYVLLEIARRDPRAEPLERHDGAPLNPRAATLDRVEDAMFLPRVVDKLHQYLGDGFFEEIEECMVLSDVRDEATARSIAERLQGHVFERINHIFRSQEPRALIHDWLIETMA